MKQTRAKRQKNVSGQQIAAIRKKRGMTQLDLAAKVQSLGVKLDRACIAKIENGLRAVLDYEIVALGKAFSCRPAALLAPRRAGAPRVKPGN